MPPGLTFQQYQEQSFTTALYPEHGTGSWGALAYAALGLNGEAGEVAEKIKKIFRDHGGEVTPEKRTELEKEIGDVMWYLAATCTELKIDLGGIAQQNLEKLFSRRERGKLQGDGDNR